MTTCRQIEKLISPYLDGELDYVDNILVEEHILKCQDCCDQLNLQKRFLSVLKSAPLREETPVDLQNKIIASLKKQKKSFCIKRPSFTGYPLRMMSGLTLGFATLLLFLFSLYNQKPTIPPFVNTSIAQHQQFLQGHLPLEFRSSDPMIISNWLKKRVAFSPELPDFDDINVILQGSSVLDLEGQLVGLISYRVHDIPVSLLMVKRSPATDIENSNHTYVGARRISFAQSDGYNAVSWSVKSTNFSLVSTLPHQGKKSCIVCHANGSGLMDLSDFYHSKT